MTTPTNTSLSNEHYTPSLIVDPAGLVLERIDLDPASCYQANDTVKAPVWFNADGLFSPWGTRENPNRVFLNPPGGKLDPATFQPTTKPQALSSAAVWWGKLMAEWDAGHVEAAIFVAFNTGVFRTAQGLGVRPPQSFPWCMPKDRIAFDVVGADGIRRPGKSPPQDSAIVLVPPKHELSRGGGDHAMTSRFVTEFSKIGYVHV